MARARSGAGSWWISGRDEASRSVEKVGVNTIVETADTATDTPSWKVVTPQHEKAERS